jgi:hypothetical protein
MSTTEPAESGEKWQTLAAHVAGGMSTKAAAAKLGIAERTAYRWTTERGFKNYVFEVRAQIASEAVGRLTAAVSTVVDTLLELTGQEHEAKTRLDACKLIMGSVGPLSEHCELRQRLELLESGR